MRKPDFERNTLRILRKEKPERATIFEIFLNDDYYERLAGRKRDKRDELDELRITVEGMRAAGYDYATALASDFRLKAKDQRMEKTVSLNDGAIITDWESFEKYSWDDPLKHDCSSLDRIKPYLPEGMKLMVMAPDGVMETTLNLMGYENLCYLLFDEPELVKAVTDKIGAALVQYYELAAQFDSVGFLCVNDDWGFNTQTFLSPAQMREYIFPWNKKIVEVGHANNKPCVLHSCGKYEEIITDVIDDMKFDARHSYEDAICPVEKAYEDLVGRIAVLGGIDMDFMVRKTPEEIARRAQAMLERTRERGGYMLGTGNSVPEYVPFENYMAMIRTATEG